MNNLLTSLAVILGVIFGLSLAIFITNIVQPSNANVVFNNQITATATPIPTPTPIWSNKYYAHIDIKATVFWIGEKATNANDYIPNADSAWDTNWQVHFGGIDTPNSRNGYYPKNFRPKENPFYFALPYNEFDGSTKKESVKNIPWFSVNTPIDKPVLKNRWIKVKFNDEVCYAQWEDVGPFEDDDFNYVFGTQKPKNERAGIDLSPALRDCLKMKTNSLVSWQFIDDESVPDGPWKEIITTSLVNWK